MHQLTHWGRGGVVRRQSDVEEEEAVVVRGVVRSDHRDSEEVHPVLEHSDKDGRCEVGVTQQRCLDARGESDEPLCEVTRGCSGRTASKPLKPLEEKAAKLSLHGIRERVSQPVRRAPSMHTSLFSAFFSCKNTPPPSLTPTCNTGYREEREECLHGRLAASTAHSFCTCRVHLRLLPD